MSDVLPFGTNACFVIKGCSLQVKLQFGRLFTASIFWAFFWKALQEKKGKAFNWVLLLRLLNPFNLKSAEAMGCPTLIEIFFNLQNYIWPSASDQFFPSTPLALSGVDLLSLNYFLKYKKKQPCKYWINDRWLTGFGSWYTYFRLKPSLMYYRVSCQRNCHWSNHTRKYSQHPSLQVVVPKHKDVGSAFCSVFGAPLPFTTTC